MKALEEGRPWVQVGERSRRGEAVVLTAELERKRAEARSENGEDGRFLRKTGRCGD